MDFSYSQEQSMLQDSIARYVKEKYDFEIRRNTVANEQGFNSDTWSMFSEMGWLGIPFSEANGGFGGTAVELMLLMEEFGRGLVAEPFVPTVLLFGGLLDASGSPLSDELIQRIIEGRVQGAFAYLERQSRFELHDVSTTALRDGDTYTLSGEKTVVFNGASADYLIVSARTSGAPCDEHGISLFLVDRKSPGLKAESYRLMDGQVATNICLDGVQVPAEQLIGEPDKGAVLMSKVTNNAIVGLAAEALGIMHTLYTETVEYAKVRKQFGVPIGSFQALQHRMADMFINYELSKSMLIRAVCSIEEESSEIEQNTCALKVMIGRAGKQIAAEAVQIHGGMGLTDELKIGHYMKRLMTINITFGDADYQQQKFAGLRRDTR